MNQNKNTQKSFEYFKKNCHTGNTAVWKNPETKRCLWIGGWNQGATFDSKTFVIDLTGNEHNYRNIPFAYTQNAEPMLKCVDTPYAGWLSLPFPDFSIPTTLRTREQWEMMTEEIKRILSSGSDVLVACHGGHGRSGLFCAIVGYLLNVKADRTWASPVEKIRKIHCEDAVETYSQEKFVYDVLGLNIAVKHVYVSSFPKKSPTDVDNYGSSCPICGVVSYWVSSIGMCANCKIKYQDKAPVREDLTAEDIQDNGLVPHTCTKSNCLGIWKAEKCGHVTHDMIIYDGLCEDCWNRHSEDAAWAENKMELSNPTQASCAVCENTSEYSRAYGVCYDCAVQIKEAGSVDYVHNTVTDAYRAVPHHCNSVTYCDGLVIADVCGHVVHDKQITDGVCPDCWANVKASLQEVQ